MPDKYGNEDGLTKHQRYTKTAKGQARNRKYEDAHPARRGRIRTGMVARDAYENKTD